MNNQWDSLARPQITARRLSPVARVCLCAALMIALLIGPAPQAKADFTYRNKLTIDKNQASSSLNHTDFPVLVGVTDNHLKHTRYGGHVTDTDGRTIIAKAPPIEDLNSESSDRSAETPFVTNSELITGTNYTDDSLEGGAIFYYVVRSADTDGDESVSSEERGVTVGSRTLGTPAPVGDSSSGGGVLTLF